MSDDEVDMTDVRRDGRPAVVEEDGRPYVEGTFTEKNIVPSFPIQAHAGIFARRGAPWPTVRRAVPIRVVHRGDRLGGT